MEYGIVLFSVVLPVIKLSCCPVSRSLSEVWSLKSSVFKVKLGLANREFSWQLLIILVPMTTSYTYITYDNHDKDTYLLYKPTKTLLTRLSYGDSSRTTTMSFSVSFCFDFSPTTSTCRIDKASGTDSGGPRKAAWKWYHVDINHVTWVNHPRRSESSTQILEIWRQKEEDWPDLESVLVNISPRHGEHFFYQPQTLHPQTLSLGLTHIVSPKKFSWREVPSSSSPRVLVVKERYYLQSGGLDFNNQKTASHFTPFTI